LFATAHVPEKARGSGGSRDFQSLMAKVQAERDQIIDNAAVENLRVPLVKKTHREKQHKPAKLVNIPADATNSRLDKVPIPIYMRMKKALGEAIGDIIDSSNADDNRKPIIFDVHSSDACDYYLAYYPANEQVGLRVLQSLYVLQDTEHSALLEALRNPDGMVHDCPLPEEKERADALLLKHCGSTDVGRFERTYDIDDLLERFGRNVLYMQQCHLIVPQQQ
jgi:hypothetical protein